MPKIRVLFLLAAIVFLFAAQTFLFNQMVANRPTTASLASSNLAGISRVHVTAMASTGTSTCGLDFIPGTSTPTGIYGEVLNTPSGVYLEPQYSNSPVKACEFGTIADGTYSGTGVVTGTNNIAMIQAAIDYALQHKFKSVCMSDGNYRTDDTIQLGWGNTFYSISFVACNMGRMPIVTGAGAGVSIFPTQIDRCALNVQGARNVAIKAISFTGQNYWYAINTVYSTPPWPSTPSGWLNPTLAKSGYCR